ncbi:MAG: hypothetical protein HYZ19_01775 [Rhodocyclales bacterium]|nr:hypothetical protein [Rhodocyclales bacterium]
MEVGDMMARMGTRFLLPVAAAALLAGCKHESASLVFTGPDHALTLSARQPYPWSKAFHLEVVMARLPDCHRRSRLAAVAADELRLEVFRPAAGAFAEPILVLRLGSRYYALGTGNCELQPFAAAPKEPGVPVGSFALAGGKLKFTAAPPPPAASAAAATLTAAPAAVAPPPPQ